MSTRSSSEPSLYVVYIILNVVSDFGTSVMFILVACFCRTSLMKVRRTLEKLLRWRAKWINMGQRVKTEIQSKLSEWKLSWVANWQILRGNGFCPMRRVRRKHFLKEQPRSLALKKNEFCIQRGYMATVATWQLTGLELTAHTEARATRMASLRLGNQRPWCQEHRNFSLQGSMLRCWHMLTSKRKEIGWKSKLCTQLLAILRGSRFLKQRNWIGDNVPISVASPLRFRWITISTRFSDTCARAARAKTSSRVRTIPFFFDPTHIN